MQQYIFIYHFLPLMLSYRKLLFITLSVYIIISILHIEDSLVLLIIINICLIYHHQHQEQLDQFSLVSFMWYILWVYEQSLIQFRQCELLNSHSISPMVINMSQGRARQHVPYTSYPAETFMPHKAVFDINLKSS